jgi:hypothetical protein
MQITSIEKPDPKPAAPIWSGTAVDGSRNLQWFYWPRHWLHVRELDPTYPDGQLWMNIDPPEGAKKAVLKAVREARS